VSDPSLDIFVEALPPRMQIDYGVRAEERGFRAAWFPEITFGDAFGPATATATKTSRIGLGTGVVGIWSRSAVTMALQAATLNELSDGGCCSASACRRAATSRAGTGRRTSGRCAQCAST